MMNRRLLMVVLIVGLAAAGAAGNVPVAPAQQWDGGAKLVPELEAILAGAGPEEPVAVVAQTRMQADLAELPPRTGYDEKVELLQSTAREAQREVLAWLETTDARDVRSFWLASGVALSATPPVIRALAAREDIAFVSDDFVVTVGAEPVLSAAAADDTDLLNDWNITRVKAPDCWAAGFNGAGIVVGNIDTGIAPGHPAFGGRWRSANGWFDAINGRPDPYDDNGHGTHCMGSAVGGNGIGVAPGAAFIAAKGLSSDGSGSSSALAACLDWMAGTGRPDVLSNSWGTETRTSTYFYNHFRNLRDLGVVVVGAVGNEGPAAETSLPPGSFPTVIGVGATSESDIVPWYSSRGPAPNRFPWWEPALWPRPDWDFINPGICAPGHNIRSAVPGGGYFNLDGTSMAAPHVAGAAAILLQRNPVLTHDEIFNLLTDHADRPSAGGPYPNNNYGWGRLNVKAALDHAAGGVAEERLVPAEPRVSAPAVVRGAGRVGYAVPAPGRVELSVYDTAGRLVRTLVSGPVAAGEHRATWDLTDNRGRRVAAGAYLYRLNAGGRVHTARSVLLD